MHSFQTFEEYTSCKLKKSKEQNVKDGNFPKLLSFSGGKTNQGILYIHGFAASLKDGEYVVAKVAETFQINTYFLRLPGHGTTIEEHRIVTYKELLDESIEAFIMMEKLCEKIILIGTSMGGLIATYIAAMFPDKCSSLILVSPFYCYAKKIPRLTYISILFKILSLFDPLIRDTKDPKRLPGYSNFWYGDFYFSSLKQLTKLSQLIHNKKTLKKIEAPLLMFYYYKNPKEQDNSASVSHMKNVFNLISQSKDSYSKLIQIEEGAHVLMSEYVYADHEKVYGEIVNFLEQVYI